MSESRELRVQCVERAKTEAMNVIGARLLKLPFSCGSTCINFKYWCNREFDNRTTPFGGIDASGVAQPTSEDHFTEFCKMLRILVTMNTYFYVA